MHFPKKQGLACLLKNSDGNRPIKSSNRLCMKTIWKASLYLGICLCILMTTSCTEKRQLSVAKIPERPAYIRQSSPGDRYTWVEGEWVVHHGSYQWKKGHWTAVRSKVWVDGQWVRKNNGWTWQRGHWQISYPDFNAGPEIVFQ
jgi:hypothetical protein